MKTTDKNFKIKNLKTILLSATVGILPCLFIPDDKFFIYGLLYLYLGFPLLVIVFGSKIKKIKENNLVDVEGRLYKRRKVEYLPFCICAILFISVFLKGVTENLLKTYLPSNLIFCLPFLTYHAFCAMFSHPLSILKSFSLLKDLPKGRSYSAHAHNHKFPSHDSFRSTRFSYHSINSHSHKFSSTSSSSSGVNNHDSFFRKHYLNPGSPSYWNK